jgi:hypothetical protein
MSSEGGADTGLGQRADLVVHQRESAGEITIVTPIPARWRAAGRDLGLRRREEDLPPPVGIERQRVAATGPHAR